MQEFDKQGFIKYMYEQFPTVFENSFTREFLDNLVNMAVKRFGHSKNATSFFLSYILPEVEFEEVKQFDWA